MNPNSPAPSESLEILTPLDGGVIGAISRAEIDMQISTAKRYPRSLAEFKNKALSMVSMDSETAESCFYSRAVGKDPETGKQKFAEGMSIRLAEIVAACYGNIRHGSFLVSQTDRQVTARGFCHDVEGNVAATVEAVEATITRSGAPMSERMRVVVAKAALSKADRDAIFKVVPRALCRVLEAQARKVALGDAQSIESRRNNALAWAGKLGVPPARVFSALGVKGVDDIGVDQLATLLGIKTALTEGDMTVEEAFPHPETQAFPHPSRTPAPPTPPASPASPAPPATGKPGRKPGRPAKARQDAPEGEPPPESPSPASDAPTGRETPRPPHPTPLPDGGLFHMKHDEAAKEPAWSRLLSRLSAHSITEEEAIAALRKSRVPVGDTLSATREDVIDMILKDFDNLVVVVEKNRTR